MNHRPGRSGTRDTAERGVQVAAGWGDGPGGPDDPEHGSLGRDFFARDVLEVAPDLLGRVVVTDGPQGPVAVRLTEVEAYAGPDDPASHAFRGRTPRTAVMFGPPGHLYTYFVYGMHWCANIVTGPDGRASAVLLRAGTVVDGLDLARRRRPTARRDDHLARGPAGLAAVLGWRRDDNGRDLCPDAPSPADRSWAGIRTGTPAPPHERVAGPRVGVSRAADVAWRFWIRGERSVSAYRAGTRPRRATTR